MTYRAKCVKCGRCLSACPYYRTLRREEISPRGRILIAEKGDDRGSHYCLGCRNCIATCPFELTPLFLSSPSFKWKNIVWEKDRATLEDFFNLIYNFDKYQDIFIRVYSGKDITDKLLFQWLKYRGINVFYTESYDNEKNEERKSTPPFNPFCDIEDMENRNYDTSLKNDWQIIFRGK